MRERIKILLRRVGDLLRAAEDPVSASDRPGRRQKSAMRRALATAAVFGLLTAACGLPAAAAPPEGTPEPRVRKAIFVVAPGVYNSELVAPYDVLQHSVFRDPSDYVQTAIVSADGGPVTTFEGITVEAHHSFADAPRADILVIPSTSGSMSDDLADEAYMGWIRKAVAEAEWVITVCDGAFPLAATGALDGRVATTFPGDRERLAEMFPEVDVRHDVRLVVDGKFITSVGGGMSYEPALWLVEKLYGRKHAAATARGLVWPWDLEEVPHLVVGKPAGPQEPAGERPAPVAVAVVEQPEADSWRVIYRFAEPVTEVFFQRRRGPDRSERWRLSGDHLSWRSVEDRDSIRVAGEAVREIALEFDSDFRPLVKQYALNLSYTDGGRLLHSGLLSVRPAAAARAPDHHWSFRTSRRRNVALLDRQAPGRLEWLEPGRSSGNGTYVYFGPREVERTERAAYLADPGLPGWMRSEVETRLPGLFDRYAEITGVELDFRPLVLLSYQPSDASGLTFKGGTLDGLVQIAAEGRAWEERTPEASLLWLERTAHEVFHFWTGEMFSTVLDGDEAWLTEGGADHHALRLAAELGLLDEAGWRRLMVERANDCLVGLAGRPLLGAGERGDFRRLYTCGSTLWLWAAEAAARATSDGEHAFVRALLADADERDRGLTTYGFLETLHRLGGGHRIAGPYVRLLFDGVAAGADELFAAQMRAAGFEVELVAPREATIGRTELPDSPEASWSRLLALGAPGP